MLDVSEQIMKGTTTVGLIFKDGVVLATEMRATMGNLIASKRAKKIYKITPRIGMTTAGGVGDAQQLVRIIQVECSLYEMRRGRTMSVGAASTLLSNYLNQNRYYPYYVQLLMGGFDEGGPSVYSVDAMGGATREEEIVATGSGSPFAYGVLEDQYRPDMTEEEAKDLAIRAVRSAMRRDAGSGENIMVVVIMKDKYEESIVSGLQTTSTARQTT
ncbi:archaeal proteasome endopeptidase complex subunit beta [Methanoculleus bourgensis]|jgi:proteasome beta subunit|uniref:Proteasome subunit beta n=1 Tax=Methanoculleus bourgensis TaxID=83986 RepID=A0A0X3BMZ9_9EURY|nr:MULTISPECIES: archaeal proteasome endopeptidase complex subunit beta [Methanoculleus]MBT0732303.1 archaeal proteasome endopeptidase complex subunit beta [Methanoculleus bourgensis]MDD3373285.1 archaeal proteasome endopeptidase complex subunit beta [Methanoculleus bourgensis]NMA88245.1 archaeal proteasome endopeptidase complex subunit beta [Methanoculleus bourgensis]NQS78515.1 archaeal proteasome endopeptidase complex subunit beta [Methanoculleus bourgensis]CVK33562.1 Proteasome subunit beta